MVDVHVIQWTAAFLAALWLTSKLFLGASDRRWQHIIIGIMAILLWIPVAYTAGNVGVADGGEPVAFGSLALGALAIFMIVVSILGLILGLLLWVEEETMAAHDALPAELQHRRRG